MKYYRLVSKKNRSLFVYPEHLIDGKKFMADELTKPAKVKWKKTLSNRSNHIEEEIWLDEYGDLADQDLIKMVRKVERKDK